MNDADTPPPSAALVAEVARARPVRTRRPTPTAVAFALLAMAWAGSVLLFAWGVRDDLGRLPVGTFLLYALASTALFGAHWTSAVMPPRGQVLPVGPSRWSWGAFLVVAPFSLWVGMALGEGGAYSFTQDERFWRRALGCVVGGLAVAAAPLGLGLLAVRRLVALGARRSTAGVGCAAGVLAGLTQALHCPVADPIHVALAHGAVLLLPCLVLALVSVWLAAS